MCHFGIPSNTIRSSSTIKNLIDFFWRPSPLQLISILPFLSLLAPLNYENQLGLGLLSLSSINTAATIFYRKGPLFCQENRSRRLTKQMRRVTKKGNMFKLKEGSVERFFWVEDFKYFRIKNHSFLNLPLNALLLMLCLIL